MSISLISLLRETEFPSSEQGMPMDIRSIEARSRNMARVRSQNTRPEVHVRSLLHRLGYRFRLHSSVLPGRPDIVLPKYHIAILVHGCFWHQHQGCKRSSRPATRVEFWNKKLDGNVARDERTRQLLMEQGWKVLVVWECEIGNREQLASKLRSAIESLSQS